MEQRYYYGENADRKIQVAKSSYAFALTGRVGGTAQGVIAVPVDQAEAFMAAALCELDG